MAKHWIIFVTILTVTNLSVTALSEPIVPPPETPVVDPKCKEFVNAWNNLKGALSRDIPEIYNGFRYWIAMSLGFDLNDLGVMNDLLCRAADAESVSEIYPIANRKLLGVFVDAYPFVQKFAASIGGYTNVRRYLGALRDFEEWRRGLGIRDAKALKNVTTVEDITEFFDVMMIRYGSRWLSFIGQAENLDLIVSSSEDMARFLYESNDRHEFATRTGLPYRQARSIWFAFYKPYIQLDDVIEPAVEFVDLVGDSGLLNLPA